MMFNNELIQFISPYSGHFDLLPIVFFSIISITFLVTVITTWINAKEKNWESNWKSKKLDFKLGSLNDISYAVATKSEKTADVMPGIILIIGLLGTFIGLGMALDKASMILGNANMAEMDNSMSQLMQMMEGLGTKFKTSTWGLLAFLLLKFFTSFLKYDEKRLQWCADKLNQSINDEKNEQISKNETYHREITTLINEFKYSLQQQSQVSFDLLYSSLTSFWEIHQQNEKNKHKNYELSASQRDKQYQDLFSLLNKNNSHIADEIKSNLEKISNIHLETSNTIKAVLEENQKSQKSTINELKDTLFSQRHSHHQELSLLLNENSRHLESVVESSMGSYRAMEKFVGENLKTVESLKSSAQNMSKAANDMGDSSEKLKTVVDSLNSEMGKLLTTMKKDLGETIHNMDSSFSKNMTEMTTNLNQTISDMSHNFKSNMSEMSKGLGQATDDISKAVNNLSSAVSTTMNEVSSTINESMDIQKKAYSAFVETSDTLNEQVISMTNLVDKLSNDITSGLKAVSESNRNIISLNKRYNQSSEQIDQLITQSVTLKNTVENAFNNMEKINNKDELLAISDQLDKQNRYAEQQTEGIKHIVEIIQQRSNS